MEGEWWLPKSLVLGISVGKLNTFAGGANDGHENEFLVGASENISAPEEFRGGV